jgi:hypothetical protein
VTHYAQTRKRFLLVAAGVLVTTLTATAQLQVGDNVNLNLAGTVAFGYSGTVGDGIQSGHGIGGGGNADLSGSYYNPNFLSFHVSPFYNQSRQNSSFQSISDSSGVNANAAIFGGSHFPGWINYTRSYNSTSTFSVPGLHDFVSQGNSDSFGIGWTEAIPDKPVLSFAYQQGGSDYSLLGANSDSHSHFRSFTTSASHYIDGFRLNADYHHSTSRTEFPVIFAGERLQQSDTGNDSYSFGASHPLFWNGSASSHFSHTDYGFNSTGSHSTGSINAVDGYLSVNPSPKLTLDSTIYYSDNLVGAIEQTLVQAGGTVDVLLPGRDSSSLTFNEAITYTVNDSLRLIARENHRKQSFLNQDYGSDSYGGVVSYFHMLFRGRFNFTQTIMRNTLSFNNESLLSYSSAAGYSRSLGHWNLSGSFNYAENQQTLLINYNSSTYSYGATIGRKLGYKMYWTVNANGSKTTVDNRGAGDYTSHSYTTALTMRKIGFSAGYARSSGSAIATGSGLTPTPVPIALSPVSSYGGKSYSVGVGGSPLRRLTFSGSYVKVYSNTFLSQGLSTNTNELATLNTQYYFRKMNFNAGYTRLFQGFTGAGTVPITSNSYYAGISRWFNFF